MAHAVRTWAQIAAGVPVSAGKETISEIVEENAEICVHVTEECTQNLGEAQTEECVSGSNLHIGHSTSDQDEISSSTAASERDALQNCIVCNGSGLLCVGLLSDPCPLCDRPMESDSEHVADEPEKLPCLIQYASTHSVALDDETTSSNALLTDEDIEMSKREGNASVQESLGEQTSTVQEPSKKVGVVTSPPGLGPPGTWIWPETKAASEDNESSNVIVWPDDSPINCFEVEFLGLVAKNCFGDAFENMSVSFSGIEDKADVELHLKSARFGDPLALLQLALERETSFRGCGCHIFHMERSEDNGPSMHVSCSQVSKDTCWDVLKTGRCPRPTTCPWEHPVPFNLNVSCEVEAPKAAMATLLQGSPVMANVKTPIQAKASFNFPNQTVDQTIALNMSAYEEDD
jgi:hypothetical protein